MHLMLLYFNVLIFRLKIPWLSSVSCYKTNDPEAEAKLLLRQGISKQRE